MSSLCLAGAGCSLDIQILKCNAVASYDEAKRDWHAAPNNGMADSVWLISSQTS